MAKFRLNELKEHLAGINSIIEDYHADRAAERAAAGTGDQPTAQDRAMDAELSPSARASYDALMKMAGGSEAWLRLQNSRGWQAPKK